MSEKSLRPATSHHDLTALRSGQDWARWLALAHPAPPLRTTRRDGGQAAAAAWAALARLAHREGFIAARGDCADGDAFTSWRDRRIHVRHDLPAGQAVIALAHQLGHVLLHAELAYLTRSGTVSCRGIRRVEAGSVACLAAAHLGLAAPAVRFPPIASWASTGPRAARGAIINAVAHRVLAATATITSHLDGALTASTPTTQPEPQTPMRPGKRAGEVQVGPLRAAPQERWAARVRDSRTARTTPGVPVDGDRYRPGPPPWGRPGHPQARSHTAAAHISATRPEATGGPDVAGAAAAADGPTVPRTQLVRVHQAAARFFAGRLAGSWVPGYLTSRGFSHAVQERWQAGYAPPGPDALTRHLRALGYRDAVIEAAGLGRTSWRGTLADMFRDRVMLPIRAADGTVIAFIGRASPTAQPGVPKYLNSPGTGLYRKSEVLFGLHEACSVLARGAQPVIVEGPLDAIAVTTAGHGRRYAGLAPCGTVLTADQAAALAATTGLRTTGVLVAFDPDRAGRRAAVKAYHLLSPHTDAVTAAVLPAGRDPAQILAGHGPAALAELLAGHTVPLADVVVDAAVDGWSRWLQFAEGQIGALRAAAPLIAAMPPACAARQVARLAHRLGLDYPTVTDAVTDALDAQHAGHALPPMT